MKKYFSGILNILILIFGFAGLYFTCFNSDGFMKNDSFLYYTVQSNIFVMIVAAFTLLFEILKLKKKFVPKIIYTFRFIAVVDITLTFLVFSVMLTPVFIMDKEFDYLLSFSNLFVHNLLPICAILDWAFFGNSEHLTMKHILATLIFPLAYLIFMLTRAFLGILIDGKLVPYFFLDYEKSSWLMISKNGLGVIYWILILLVTMIFVGLFYKKIANQSKI